MLLANDGHTRRPSNLIDSLRADARNRFGCRVGDVLCKPAVALLDLGDVNKKRRFIYAEKKGCPE